MSTPSRTMAYEIFHSKSLFYLPMEPNDDSHDDFLYKWRRDAGNVNMIQTLAMPGGDASSREIRENLGSKTRLAVYICVPASGDPKTMIPLKKGDSKKEDRDTLYTVVGYMALGKPGLGNDTSWHLSQGSIGMCVVPKYQGKGYGTEALQWMLWFGFSCAGLHRMALGCAGWNTGAKRMYERAGFQVEGKKRDALFFMGGWHDEYWLSMLAHEWRALQEKEGDAKRPDGLSTDEVANLMGSA